MDKMAIPRKATPVWLLIAAGVGIAWNAFGVVQWLAFANQTPESLMMKGMSKEAADLCYALPIWMTFAFALGSIGGVVGSVLIAMRRASSLGLLAVSLAGYVALFAGDYAYGVFDVVKGQMAILTLVVIISTALVGVAVMARKRALLR